MKAVYCPYCGGRTKRNGRTSSGSQRWRCTACGASTTVRYDDTATRLEEFLGWLLSKDSQATMPGGGRSFRRRTAEFWEVWPMPVPDGELHRVLYVDGIWVARDLVVLICCSGERVVSWYMARSENSRAWSALMAPIPAPDVVDWQHLFGRFREGQPRFPELDRRHVAQRRVDPEVVVPVHVVRELGP